MASRALALLPLLLAPSLLGCTDDGDGGPPDVITGGYHAFVQRGWAMPATGAEAAEIGFDLDADQRPDNAIGQLVGGLANLGLEVDVANAELLGTGDPILAHVIRSNGLTDDASVAWQLWRAVGTPPRFDGTDRVVADAIEGELWGAITAGTLSAHWGSTVVRVPLFPGQAPILLPLTDARLELVVDGPCRGRLGGGVDDAALTVALEEMARQTLVHMEANPEHTFTSAATSIMDADRDGVVTVPEVVAIARALLFVDLDRDGDGDGDAASFALGFECARAQLVAMPAF